MGLAACVKHELHDTEHPDKGALVVTADFGGRSAEASVPDSYIISLSSGEGWAEAFSTTVSGETNTFGKLLSPGAYNMLVYNTPEGITINGTVATVNSVGEGVRSGSVQIESRPEYLFGAYQRVTIMEDDTTYVVARMRQYIKLLNITLNVKDGDSGRIASVECKLDGVETSVDLSTGVLSGSSACTVNGMTLGDGTITTFFRILGIVPTERQTITVTITYTDGEEEIITSDITDIIDGINDEEDTPTGGDGDTPTIDISGEITLPTESGFEATIEGWQQANDGFEAK